MEHATPAYFFRHSPCGILHWLGNRTYRIGTFSVCEKKYKKNRKLNNPVATGSDDWTIRICNVDERKHIKTFGGYTGKDNSVVYSQDGETIASGSSDGTILLWDITEFKHPTETVSQGD